MDTIVNISRPLTELARSQPGTPAIIFPQEHRTLTYRQLDEESDRLARGLARLGIGRGVRTALLVPPGPELFALTFALFKGGAIPVFIDPGIGARNLKGCLAEAAPTAFIGTPSCRSSRRRAPRAGPHTDLPTTSASWGERRRVTARDGGVGTALARFGQARTAAARVRRYRGTLATPGRTRRG